MGRCMEMNKNDESLRPAGEIIPPDLAVRAMRDSGYRNTAYALAELIDNSVQAEAKDVEVICFQKRQIVNKKEVPRMAEIAVIDNGKGMDAETLRLALQFGNGTRLSAKKGIGKFGMGLPNSSVSQCRRLEVWTWQNGPDNALYTYLDIDEIEGRLLAFIPEPSKNPVPQKWRKRSNIIGTTGTLVLWTKFDEYRLTWRGSKATLRNTEEIVGRMYRKFIDDGRVAIKLLALEDEDESVTFDHYVRVNDPLYLMKNSSTPPPFDKEPMFQNWGEDVEEFSFKYKGETQKIIVRISWARQETVVRGEGQKNRGDTPYGKHAKKNLGLSIVRAGRELDLDDGWTSGSDPIDRWWGIEVEFEPALDDIFGVTNNKQSATIFSQMAKFDWENEAYEGEKLSEFKERFKNEGDPRSFLFPVSEHIYAQIYKIREKLKEQTKGLRSKGKRHDEVEDEATRKVKERVAQGHKTEQDDEKFGEKERAELKKNLEEKGYSEDIAIEIAQATFENQRKVIFVTKMMEGWAFFNIEHQHGGVTQVVFNSKHPFYKRLFETLEPDIGDETDSDLLERIHDASETLKLLFAAWARCETEEEVSQQEVLSDMRQEWGRMARFFLTKSSK